MPAFYEAQARNQAGLRYAHAFIVTWVSTTIQAKPIRGFGDIMRSVLTMSLPKRNVGHGSLRRRSG